MIYPFFPGARPGVGPASDAVSADSFGVALLALLPRLRRYAIALVGDRAAADDLVQDSVERALRHRDHLKDSRKLFGWLRSILHNLHIDGLRERRSQGVIVEYDESLDAMGLSVPQADRTAALDFTRALDTLSTDHRQILLLIGMEGLSYREIAEELKVPIGTVMSRLARARDHLRTELERTGPARKRPDPDESPARKVADRS